EHCRLKARIVDFAGFEMPISYDSVTGGMIKEHLAVRQKAGIFDICHMGEFWVRGSQATDYLSFLCTRPVQPLKNGRALYCLLLKEKGFIVDDIIIYKNHDQEYLLVVNAANMEKVWQHVLQWKTEFDVQLENVSEQTALLSVQGPLAKQIVPGWYP